MKWLWFPARYQIAEKGSIPVIGSNRVLLRAGRRGQSSATAWRVPNAADTSVSTKELKTVFALRRAFLMSMPSSFICSRKKEREKH